MIFTLPNLVAGTMVLSITAYVLLAGADFGGGVWDLLSRGARKQSQRALIANAIGPVWEANHVWLILVVVMLFSCFPARVRASLHRAAHPAHSHAGGRSAARFRLHVSIVRHTTR